MDEKVKLLVAYSFYEIFMRRLLEHFVFLFQATSVGNIVLFSPEINISWGYVSYYKMLGLIGF